MAQETTVVTTVEELQTAIANAVPHITVSGTIKGMPMITLKPGQTLAGKELPIDVVPPQYDGVLQFGARGVQLTSDNTLTNLVIRTGETESAILLNPEATSLGTLTLRNVVTVGQVALLVSGATTGGHVEVENLHIASADVRGRAERPADFGVQLMQGAFTLWNTQKTDVTITAELRNISAGSSESPIRGVGVLIGGQPGPGAGRVEAGHLTLGELHTNGGIAENTPDLIAGGVFVIYGASVREIENTGSVTTYGPNDMALDIWGKADRWRVLAPITTYGSSGIGFVQFGDIGTLEVDAPIETFGQGARGYNIFVGNVGLAAFQSVRTHGGGGVGIQLASRVGKLLVTGSVVTEGGVGLGLVKGVVTPIKAVALLLQPAKHSDQKIDSVIIDGALVTNGAGIEALRAETSVTELVVRNGIQTTGENSPGIVLDKGVNVPYQAVCITSTGQPVVIEEQ